MSILHRLAPVILAVGAAAVLLAGSEVPERGSTAEASAEQADVGAIAIVASKDAASYGAEFGVSEQEAARRLELQAATGRVLENLRLEDSGTFAGIWLEHQPDFKLIAKTTGDGAEYAALETLSPIPVEVRGGAAVSFVGLSGFLKIAQAGLSPAYDLAGAYVDLKAGAVVFDIQPTTLPDSAFEEEAARLSGLIDAPVRLNRLASLAGDDVMRGGKSVGGCTSAFAIGTYSGSYGLLTNAHCLDLYNLTSCALTYDYSTASCWRNHAYGASHDVQWRTVVGDSAAAEFWDGSAHRPVYDAYSWSAQQVGWYACHYGKTTGYSCGTIANKNYQPTYGGACPSGPCNSDWIMVTGAGLACTGGDSGGPWFVAGSAYGVHKGSPSPGCIYMPIDRITAMSVFVLTQ